MSSQAAQATIDHHHDATTSTGIPNKKLFMWTFLASDCMFFGSLISMHVVYRVHPPAGSPDPRSIFSIELTSFSTFILLMSSLLMALAVNAIQKGNLQSTRRNLLGTIFFGLIFLGCQIYEFQHFVHEKGLTLSSSLFGSTFYTLTGTHGCHVAIGVLWLIFMYIRTFKPENADASRKPWFIVSIAHFLVFAVAVVLGVHVVVSLAHQIQTPAFAIGGFLAGHALALIGLLVSLAGLYAMGRQSGAVDFNQSHAIDVESMGLYWHFVDIVWIIIFPVVYLLEYF
ncbi:MAG: heme-copper oxidase subunit III [Opitutaceae bacterium]|nr:heme-copper oxidase subunit III [Opitutaceae bacterium]